MNEDDGYTFVATLFSSTDDPNIGLAHYYLRILTAPSTMISISRKTTLLPTLYSMVRSSSTIGDHCTTFQRGTGF